MCNISHEMYHKGETMEINWETCDDGPLMLEFAVNSGAPRQEIILLIGQLIRQTPLPGAGNKTVWDLLADDEYQQEVEKMEAWARGERDDDVLIPRQSPMFFARRNAVEAARNLWAFALSGLDGDAYWSGKHIVMTTEDLGAPYKIGCQALADAIRQIMPCGAWKNGNE